MISIVYSVSSFLLPVLLFDLTFLSLSFLFPAPFLFSFFSLFFSLPSINTETIKVWRNTKIYMKVWIMKYKGDEKSIWWSIKDCRSSHYSVKGKISIDFSTSNKYTCRIPVCPSTFCRGNFRKTLLNRIFTITSTLKLV